MPWTLYQPTLEDNGLTRSNGDPEPGMSCTSVGGRNIIQLVQLEVLEIVTRSYWGLLASLLGARTLEATRGS